jgi:hypothetical protein
MMVGTILSMKSYTYSISMPCSADAVLKSVLEKKYIQYMCISGSQKNSISLVAFVVTKLANSCNIAQRRW